MGRSIVVRRPCFLPPSFHRRHPLPRPQFPPAFGPPAPNPSLCFLFAPSNTQRQPAFPPSSAPPCRKSCQFCSERGRRGLDRQGVGRGGGQDDEESKFTILKRVGGWTGRGAIEREALGFCGGSNFRGANLGRARTLSTTNCDPVPEKKVPLLPLVPSLPFLLESERKIPRALLEAGPCDACAAGPRDVAART